MDKLSERGFAHILVILLLLAGLAASVYLVQQKTNIFPKAASPETLTTLNQKSSDWKEIFSVPSLESRGEKEAESYQKTFSVSSPQPLEKISTRPGRLDFFSQASIRIISPSSFPKDISSSSYGVLAIAQRPDGVVFYGGVNGAAFAPAETSPYLPPVASGSGHLLLSNFQAIQFPRDFIVLSIGTTQNNSVYFSGYNGVFLYTPSGELVDVASSRELSLGRAKLTPYQNGVTSFTSYYLLYFEGNQWRAWESPRKTGCPVQDKILWFTSTISGQAYGAVYQCDKDRRYRTYLQKFEFSIDRTVPLIVTTVGKITDGWLGITSSVVVFDESLGRFYFANITSSKVTELNLKNTSLLKEVRVCALESCSDIESLAIDSKHNLWVAWTEVSGISVLTPNYELYQHTRWVDDPNKIANHYLNVVTAVKASQMETILIGHKYYRDYRQGETGLVTRFEFK